MRRTTVSLLCGCALTGLLGPASAVAQRGSIVAWGGNSHGQLDVPSPNTDFVAIVAKGEYSLALKADGSIL